MPFQASQTPSRGPPFGLPPLSCNSLSKVRKVSKGKLCPSTIKLNMESSVEFGSFVMFFTVMATSS